MEYSAANSGGSKIQAKYKQSIGPGFLFSWLLTQIAQLGGLPQILTGAAAAQTENTCKKALKNTPAHYKCHMACQNHCSELDKSSLLSLASPPTTVQRPNTPLYTVTMQLNFASFSFRLLRVSGVQSDVQKQLTLRNLLPLLL